MNISLCPRSRLRIWPYETGSAVPSRVSLLISTLLRLNLALIRDSSQVSRRRPFIYLKPPYAIGSVLSLSGHAMAYRWRSLPRVRQWAYWKYPKSRRIFRSVIRRFSVFVWFVEHVDTTNGITYLTLSVVCTPVFTAYISIAVLVASNKCEG